MNIFWKYSFTLQRNTCTNWLVIAVSIWNFVAVTTHPRQIWGRLLSCLWLSTLSFWTPLQDIIDNQYPRKPKIFSSLKRKEHRAELNKITENPFCLLKFTYCFCLFPISPLRPFWGGQKQVFGGNIKAKIIF